MCGLVGIISNKVLSTQNTNVFKKLLIMDQVRGKDSVGVIAVDDKQVAWEKSVIDPVSFLEHRRVSPLLLTAHSLIGHNRAATRGGVSLNNAHPFNHGDITLVHNGTLTFNAVTTPHFVVDSESIAYALSQKEPHEAKVVLESLDGAYALIWYDARDKSFNIARNEERPLHYMTNAKFDTMYLSSEAGILYAATAESYDVDIKTHIHEIPVGSIWKIKAGASELVREVTPFEPKKFLYPIGKKVGVTTGATTTAKAGDSTRRSNIVPMYDRGRNDFLKHFGAARWEPIEIDKIAGHESSSVRTVLGWMVNEPWSKVVLNGVSKDSLPAIGDTIEVYLHTLYEDSFHNKAAIKSDNMSMATLTAVDWRKLEEEPVLCSCCSGIFTKDEVTYFKDHEDYVCKKCLADPYIQSYYSGDMK